MTSTQRRAAAALDTMLAPERSEGDRASARRAWRHLVSAGVQAECGTQWWDGVIVPTLAATAEDAS